MILKILGSSSKGNCYIIETDSSKLILESGVKFKEVQKALDFDFSNVTGCLITHEHGDHSKYINDFIDNGIDIYTSKGTANKLNVTGHRIKIVKMLEQIQIKDFIVLPFDTQHDCVEPLRLLDTIYSYTEKNYYLQPTRFI